MRTHKGPFRGFVKRRAREEIFPDYVLTANGISALDCLLCDLHWMSSGGNVGQQSALVVTGISSVSATKGPASWPQKAFTFSVRNVSEIRSASIRVRYSLITHWSSAE